MSTSCKLYKSILFQLLLQLKFKKKEATISEKRVSFALSGPPEGYSVNSIKEDACIRFRKITLLWHQIKLQQLYLRKGISLLKTGIGLIADYFHFTRINTTDCRNSVVNLTNSVCTYLCPVFKCHIILTCVQNILSSWHRHYKQVEF